MFTTRTVRSIASTLRLWLFASLIAGLALGLLAPADLGGLAVNIGVGADFHGIHHDEKGKQGQVLGAHTAHYDFDETQGRLVYTPGQVQAKYFNNADNFRPGYVTPDDVKRVARKYFQKENRAVLVWARKGGTAEDPALASLPAEAKGMIKGMIARIEGARKITISSICTV